jgi:hypothetical protein
MTPEEDVVAEETERAVKVKIKAEDLPELEGWVSMPAAAAKLGRTRQRSSQLVEDGFFETAHRIMGTPGTRPALIVVREAELRVKLREREEAAADKEAAKTE